MIDKASSLAHVNVVETFRSNSKRSTNNELVTCTQTRPALLALLLVLPTTKVMIICDFEKTHSFLILVTAMLLPVLPFTVVPADSWRRPGWLVVALAQVCAR
jgi:hypothetical protein